MDEPTAERLFLAIVRAFAPLGYGRLMQLISHEWYRHDPSGAALADTCYGLLPAIERAAYAVLAEADPAFLDEE